MNTTSLACANSENMTELASTVPVDCEGMYVAAFKEACYGVLLQEAYLFSDEEQDYLERALSLSDEALYLLVRLSRRKLTWHLKSDMETRYRNELVSNDRIHSACDLLSSRSLAKLSTSESSTLSVPSPTKTINQMDIIELAIDSSDDDENAREGGIQRLSPAYHASNHSWPELHELLDVLNAEEKKRPARRVEVSKPCMKGADFTPALLSNSKKQTALNFKVKYEDRLTEMAMEKIGYCNKSVMSLFRRIHNIYFRDFDYDTGLFDPVILVRCKERNYVQYDHERTKSIFRSREELLEYEEALAAEAKMELARDAYTTGITKGSDTAQQLFEEVYTWVHIKYAEQLRKVNVKRFRKDSLKRFETGHVLVKILHHSGELVNKIKGPCAEAELLRMLLQQTRWKRGSRGQWYDRLGLLLMKDKDNKAALQEAIKTVRGGLKDEFTQLCYRPSLCRRLARLENMLSVPVEVRWKDEAPLKDCDHVYVEGVRRDKVTHNKSGHFNSASRADSSQHAQAPTTKYSRSLWSGKEKTVNVEQLAIEYYESLGYRAIHSEGSVVRFIFALLFKDILFKPVPGALETQYQREPLDLNEDSFYFARREDIDRRLEAILSGQASDIARKVDSEHRDKNTTWVGALWDRFTREDILAIIECLPASVLMIICGLQVKDYSGSGCGVPDLIVWNHKKRKAKFAEVKGPQDTLRETQKLWIHWILSFGGTVEVCHIETHADKEKRLEKEKRESKQPGNVKGKKRKCHAYDDKYRPKKKGRIE